MRQSRGGLTLTSVFVSLTCSHTHFRRRRSVSETQRHKLGGDTMVSHVFGLDLSLTSTGIARIGPAGTWVDRIRSVGTVDDRAQLRRLRGIRDSVLSYVGSATDLIVVEGLSHGSRVGQHLTRAGLWHLVIEALDSRGLAWAEVAPTARAKYATGRGNAAKDDVLAAVVRRFPAVEVRGNDEADALTLAAMGADWLGCPLVDMPAAHRVALEKVRWPELVSA